MKPLSLRFLLTFFVCLSASITHAQTYTTRQLACGLSQPWEIKFGPDGWLWTTQAHSYQLSRIDPVNGTVEMMLDLSAKKNFPNFAQATEWPQGGLQGFAFHPGFSSNPYIYIAYVHRFDSCASGTNGCFFKTRIVRYNYDMGTKAFTNETVMIDTLPGSNDHNGGRLVIGPNLTAGNAYLFYSIGDMGSGHLSNRSRPHHGQMPEYYEGKVLRFNLTTDGDAGGDGWIPNDNPFNVTGRQSAVWSLGHRNPQGLAFGADGTLYEAEHGPYSDDEINIIRRANNYGFPLIMGFAADGNYDGSKAGAGSAVPLVTSESANRAAIQTNYTYSDPIFSLFPASKTEVSTIWNNDLNNTPPYANYYLQWPTSAPSGIEYYGSDAIPGWKPSLLVANLKLANVYRLKLASDGQSVVGDTIPLFQGQGRYRDIAVSADGLKIYVAADSVGAVKGAPGASVTPPNKGCILEFSFTASSGVAANQHTSAIKLYPNPASGSFVLQLPQELSAADVSILNMLGKTVAAVHVTSAKASISTAGLPPGIYTIRVTSDNQIWSERLIVK